jgi:Helix-turn-helix domain
MSIQAVAWALSLNIPDPFAKLVLVSLANHANNETGHCWPTHSLIAKEASCNRRTVMRKVPYLSQAGHIRVFHHHSQGRALDYQVLFPGVVPLANTPLRKKRR